MYIHIFPPWSAAAAAVTKCWCELLLPLSHHQLKSDWTFTQPRWQLPLWKPAPLYPQSSHQLSPEYSRPPHTPPPPCLELFVMFHKGRPWSPPASRQTGPAAAAAVTHASPATAAATTTTTTAAAAAFFVLAAAEAPAGKASFPPFKLIQC